MMDFENIDWADSDLEKIEIEYNKAILTIFNYTLGTRLSVHCEGLIGLTNLCVWDDTTILSAQIVKPTDTDGFIQQVFSAYDKDFSYGGRMLNQGIVGLCVELTNFLVFRVYCLKIIVVPSED